MSTLHQPVPDLSSIAVDPSYSSHYTYHSQPLDDILCNEPMIPSCRNVEPPFTQIPHPHYPPQHNPSPQYFRSQHANQHPALAHSTITPHFNHPFFQDPFQYNYSLPQQPLCINSHSSLYHSNVPSYQTTTAKTVTHSSQFSHHHSHGSPPLPQRPRLDTSSLNPFNTGTAHHSSSHIIHATSSLVAPPPPPAPTASPCLQQYVAYLKQLYITKKTPVYDKECSLLYYKAKAFINIALVHKNVKTTTERDKNEMIMDRLHGHVDAIQKRKTKLDFSDVCKCDDDNPACCVLVEGAPGVGKTTFAFELCKQWARGKILQECRVVVIIKLRDQRTRTAQTINDLLYHPDPETRHQVVKELVEENGKGMLLILDGYDELTTKQKEFGSVIQLLMSRELLCQATLMVTSRPLATRTLHHNFLESIYQHIEVLGFTDKNIEEYINSACGDNPELVEDFKKYLSCHPFSSSLMFNPLQCAIVTDLYRSHWHCKDKGFAPKTLTELYTGLVHTLLLRYLTHHPVHKDNDWTINTLNDLPEDVKQHLKAVTALAANGLKKQQYVFDKKDDSVPSETLGLMQREEELTAGAGRSSSYNFLHLTLQEYLAAVHYSQQYNSPEQLTQLLTQDNLFPLRRFLQHYGEKTKSTIHWPVVLFLAGRTQLSGIHPILLKAASLHNSHDTSSDASVDVSLLHLLYETQCPQLIQSTLVTSRMHISVSGDSALDWFVIGYCIANSTSSWRVEKKATVNPDYFNHLVMGLKLAPQDGSGEGKIVSLDLCELWYANLRILQQLQPYTKNVSAITLTIPRKHLHDLMSSTEEPIDEHILDSYPLLEKLTIKGSDEIKFYCIPQQSTLHSLILWNCKLSSEVTSSLIHSLQSSNKRLMQNLSFSDCTFSNTYQTYQFSFFQLLETNGKYSLNAKGSSYAINHWLLYIPSYTILMTDLILEVTKQDSSADETLQGISLDNLRTLSLTKCELSCEATSLLIYHLQSSNSRLLQKLLFINCTLFTTDHTYQFFSFQLLETKGKYSLKAKGSSYAINHWLLYIPSYANLMTELILEVTEQDTSADETLQGISLDNLRTLSLTKCELSSEATSSLIYHLQSFNSRLLQKLLFINCTLFTTDHTYQFSFFQLLETKGKFSLNASGSSCAINHWLLYIPSYVNLMTELILDVTEQDSSADETLQGISLDNLRTLSLTKCELSSEATSSLIHSLISPDYKLNKLSLCECTISTTDYTYTYQFSSFTLQHTDGEVCLNATGSCSEINHWLSQLSSYTEQKLTQSILEISKQDSTSNETLESISLYRLVLKILKIENWEKFAIPQFIRQQQNNLHTLSLYQCNLSSKATSSFVHTLRSPHCRLHKLALYGCTVPTTEHTLLTTAIVSSTTITHLLFIDYNIDTPSLTALVSGLKHNKSLKELVIDNVLYSKSFTTKQSLLLIEGVDCSNLKKLWLDVNYKKQLGDIFLSRYDLVIEWYHQSTNLYKKW